MNALLVRLSSHVSSTSLAGIMLVYYLLGDGTALDSFLPINGKPLACFLLIAVVVLLELMTKSNKAFTEKLCEISRDIEVNSVKGAIAGLHRMYLSRPAETITNDAIIREIHATRDNMLRLGINSYSQQKIEFLVSKIDLARGRD